MSAIVVFVGLLVLSYAGSFLVGGRTLRGAGLPSSVEYVLLGFILGPHVLGIIGRDLESTFQPLAQVALGWLALLIGLDFGQTNERRAHWGSMTLGVVTGGLTAAAVGASVWFYTTRLLHAPRDMDHLLLAGGIAAVCSETTRHVVRWVVQRHGADGGLTRFLGDFAHADDLVPLLLMAVLFSFAPMPITRVVLSPWAWVAITIGFGILLGAMTAMHIGRELRTDPTWGVLLGMSVLGLGVAARIGMSTLTVLFFMGWATARLSRHAPALRAMVAPVERPILLPAMLLAGAHVDFRSMTGLAAIVAIAVAARVFTKVLFGALLSFPHKSSAMLGAGLLSTGALSISVGLAFAIRFPGPIGNAVLSTAFVVCVVGEILGPFSLRRVLLGKGEITLLVPEPSQPPVGTESETQSKPERETGSEVAS